MEIILILIVGAVLSAAWGWWWISRPGERRATRLVGFGNDPLEEATSDVFVFEPSEASADDDDRPPPGMSLARLALAIALSAAVLVAVAWAVGFLIKLQLDRYFLAGG